MMFVYIVNCSDDTLYTGYTTDLNRRMKKHNSCIGAKYTRGRTPVKLVYFEEYETKSEAMKREVQIKKMTREKKIKMILNFDRNNLLKYEEGDKDAIGR